jgi:hypothetical protein
MKKYFQTYLFLLSLIIGKISFSQGNNLQFNRAIFSELSQSVGANIYNGVTIGTITVPQGKVWKLERVSLIGNFPCGVGQTDYSIFQAILFINNLVIGEYGNYEGFFPIWLPEGTYNFKSNVTGGCTNYPYNLKVSYNGIEFNLTP